MTSGFLIGISSYQLELIHIIMVGDIPVGGDEEDAGKRSLRLVYVTACMVIISMSEFGKSEELKPLCNRKLGE